MKHYHDMHDNSISYDPPSPPETAMLPVGPRLVGSRRCLQCFSQKLASSSSPSPLRAVIASSGVGRKSSRRFSSSDDRERQTAAALSRAAPTPTPPPLHQGKHNLAATEILINRSGLLPTRMHHGVDNRPPLKGLAKELEQMIMLNGPITVAEYMIYALQHPQHGYYMRQKDKIGLGGDFITAPEISQVRNAQAGSFVLQFVFWTIMLVSPAVAGDGSAILKRVVWCLLLCSWFLVQ